MADSGDSHNPSDPHDPGRDADELAALRARVAQLEAETSSGAAKRQHHRVRSFFSALCIVLAAVLAPLSAVAVWTSSQVGDTARFTATMAPLAANPDVQDAVANRVSNAVIDNINIDSVLADVAPTDRPRIDALLGRASDAINSGLSSLVHNTTVSFMQSPAFQQVWRTVLERSHATMVKALTGSGGGAVQLTNDAVQLDLAPVVDQVKQQLVNAGLGVASHIPETHTSFTLVEAKDIGKVKTGFRLLQIMGNWLPVLVGLLVAGGVLLAVRRRRALVTAALAVGAGVAVLGIGLAVFRSVYLGNLPAGVSEPAAKAVYDILVRYLRTSVRVVLTLAIVVALGAWLSGPGRWAGRVRSAWASGIATVRRTLGVPTGPVGPWVHRFRTWLVWAAVAIAALVAVLWSYPTGLVILGIALTFVFVLAVIEFLDDPGPAADRSDAGAAAHA